MDRLDFMNANQHILVRLPSKNIKVVQLVPESVISLGKFGSFRADDLVGDPFGFTYEIGEDMKLSIVDDPAKGDFDDNDETLGAEQTLTGDKIQAMGAQSLTTEEIEALKKQGVSGEEIIARVTGGHANFEQKTEYSKDKYLKRKKQKFLRQFTPEPIGVSEMIDIYLDKDASKIMNISAETISLMLTYANARPGGNYLVIDETPGIAVMGLLERMDNDGRIVLVHDSEHPNLSGLRYLDMDEETRAERIKTINYLDLLHPEESERVTIRTEEELAELKPGQRGQYYRAVQREKDHDWIREVAHGQGFDGLIVMTDVDLSSLVPRMIPFIGGSRPIVLYSEFKEQLVNATLTLKDDLRVVAPTIMETRVRKYQTLPGRIHPMMTSRSYGGYILWATKVLPAAEAQAAGRGYQKRKKVKTENGAEATNDVNETTMETEEQ